MNTDKREAVEGAQPDDSVGSPKQAKLRAEAKTVVDDEAEHDGETVVDDEEEDETEE